MIRYSSIFKCIVALILPLTFLWSWAACSLLCGEITARHEKQPISLVEQKSGSCVIGFDTDGCPYTANAVIIEARQTAAAPILAIINIAPSSAREISFVAASVYPADRNQNSPPRASSDPPLFLRHCNFRI